jgi:F-type H+-transporting ATPase subunit epsilon
MKLTIVSPEKTIFAGDAQSVTVPGSKGEFEVLDNHAPIISSMNAGTLKFKAGEERQINIQGGFIDVANNEVSVCVEMSE